MLQSSFPCVLEYLPYRKSDFTSESDHLRHPWLASHGYVAVRADIRGSGDSDGILRDEYSDQEWEDGMEVVEWLRGRSWCDGGVGLFGYSRGGINGLQMAASSVGIKAVVSGFSCDDRFTDDVHYWGGCLIGNGFMSWASFMPVTIPLCSITCMCGNKILTNFL